MFYCRICEKETDWIEKRIKKRKVYVCQLCNRNFRGIEGFMKSAKGYDDKKFIPSTDDLMKDPNMKYFEDKEQS